LRNLQKSDGRYFLKTSPRHLIGSFRTRLLREAEIVFLQRKNLYENLLSFLVSQRTGIYYRAGEGGIRAKKNTLRATREDFEAFVGMHQDLRKMMRKYPDAKRLT